MFKLRPYQQEATDSGIEFFNNQKDKHPSIIVIPTGGGKSLVIAKIAQALDGNVVVFQPSKELLEQNYSKFVGYGGIASIYSASKNRRDVSKVTFATIGSVVKKTDLFKEFQYCIIDECHLVSPDKSSMYQKFFGELNVKILGLTATPIRLKQYNYPEKHSKLCMLNRMKPRVFKNYIHITQISELVEQGFFSPTKYLEIDFDTSKLRVNTTGAEFTEHSISTALAHQNISEKTVSYARKAIDAGRKHVLIFTPKVDEADYIAKRLHGKSVSAQTKKKERETILNDFKAGRVDVVANVGVLTTGFDFPELDTIILARPTMSLALYYQMIGRGVRPHDDKGDCLVIDLVGNFQRFGRVEELTILNRKGWGIFTGNRLLTNVDMDEHVEITDEPTMSFGKYKGEKLKDVPVGYWGWFYETIERKPYNKFIFDFIEENVIIKQPDSL